MSSSSSTRINDLAGRLSCLKEALADSYRGDAQTYEVIPMQFDGMDAKDLDMLHRFAQENPIYYDSHRCVVGGTDCIIYEGDINRYWLGSIQNNASHAPFSPTWMMSALVAVLQARDMGYMEVVDVGSGDGRIAFCAQVLNLKPYSLELDRRLAMLQESVACAKFETFCCDATTFEYSKLGLQNPVFFAGGLAQMGGTRLASEIMDMGFKSWVLVGSMSSKYAADPRGCAGWGTLISKYGLDEVHRLALPAAWTVREPDDTVYIFVRDRNPH